MAIQTYRDKLHSLQQRAKKIREESQKASQIAMNTGVAAGSAFGISYLEAAYPTGIGAGVFGMDLSLIVGIAGVGASAAGLVSGQNAQLLESAGIGALAAFAAKKGKEKGAEAAKK